MYKGSVIMFDKLNHIAERLRERGFDAAVFRNAQEAAGFLLSDVPAGSDIAIGGSMTVKQMDLHTQLRAQGHKVIWHWEAAPGEHKATLRAAMNAPVYLCSANAITEDGLIVQIDGNGNRVAAISYGPDTVYILIGRNKIVAGGMAQAVRRIKQVACPANARRLNLNTPCAKDGKCDVSACTQSMCHLFLAIEGAPGGKKTHVVLVNEDLGY